MSAELLMTYILVCTVLAATPGPTMSLVVANSSIYGLRAGLMTIAGNTAGLIILVTIAVLGMNTLMVFVAQWFDWLRWIGAAYLIWLGVSQIRAASNKDQEKPVLKQPGNHHIQGFFIALSNPKVLLFLGAFFPQFIRPNDDISTQLIILAILFVFTLSLVDCIIAVFAYRASKILSSQWRYLTDYIAGSILIIGGLGLIIFRKS